MLGESGHFDNIVVPSRIIGLTGGNPLFAAHWDLFWHRAGVMGFLVGDRRICNASVRSAVEAAAALWLGAKPLI
jgi:hypothetical protein